MQHRAMRLMASKLAVAGVIEGSLTDEGLAAMSDCQDMATALARELANGIGGEVEGLKETFRKMAIIKPAAPADASPAENMANIAAEKEIQSTEEQETKKAEKTPGSSTTRPPGPARLPTMPLPAKPQSKRPKPMPKNQISLLDLLKESA